MFGGRCPTRAVPRPRRNLPQASRTGRVQGCAGPRPHRTALGTVVPSATPPRGGFCIYERGEKKRINQKPSTRCCGPILRSLDWNDFTFDECGVAMEQPRASAEPLRARVRFPGKSAKLDPCLATYQENLPTRLAKRRARGACTKSASCPRKQKERHRSSALHCLSFPDSAGVRSIFPHRRLPARGARSRSFAPPATSSPSTRRRFMRTAFS